MFDHKNLTSEQKMIRHNKTISIQPLMDTDTSFVTFSTFRELTHFIQQTTEGLAHIHSCGYVHRDIKPENIFLDISTRTYKIGDFDFAHPAETYDSNIAGSVLFMRPKISSKPLYKDDLWALDITILDKLGIYNPPYRGQDATQSVHHALEILKYTTCSPFMNQDEKGRLLHFLSQCFGVHYGNTGVVYNTYPLHQNATHLLSSPLFVYMHNVCQ